MRASLVLALLAAVGLIPLVLGGCCCKPHRCPRTPPPGVVPPVVVHQAPEEMTALPPGRVNADPTATALDEAATAPEPRAPNESDEQRPFDAAAAGVVVRVPRGWKSRMEEEYTFLLEGPLRIPTAALFEPRARTVEAAAAGLATELDVGIDAVRVTSAPRPATFAGYPALVAEGTGSTGGVKLYWRAWVVEGRRLFVAAVTTPAMMWKLQKGRVRTFVGSVQRHPDARP